jgi:hypothetical protein
MDQLSGYGLIAGDLLYTDLSGDEHTFMIVGWGPYVETWQQLANVTVQQIKPQRDLQNAPVLYIVDHGPHGLYATTPSPYSIAISGYKPYYAAWWYSSSNINIEPTARRDFVGGNRHFVHIPNIYTLPYIMVAPDATFYPTQQAVKVDMQLVCPVTTRIP